MKKQLLIWLVERLDKAERYRLLLSILTCVTTQTVINPILMGILNRTVMEVLLMRVIHFLNYIMLI